MQEDLLRLILRAPSEPVVIVRDRDRVYGDCLYPSSHSPESGGHLHVFDSYRASLVGLLCLCSNKLLNSEVHVFQKKRQLYT